MNIKYYLVNKADLFIDELLKELCKRNISYIRVENEIHFEDYIIRFIDKRYVTNINKKRLATIDKIENTKTNIYRIINHEDELIEHKNKHDKKTNYIKTTKHDLKQESKNVNLILRKYQR